MSGEAPAIQQLRTDANTTWPKRDKSTDGTWGDDSHQARKSDHNTGDAIDVTDDPKGAAGNVVAAYAIRDPRVKYVIWNRRIYNTANPGWRPFPKWKKMPHDKHVHVSVKQAARADTSAWGWTQPGAPPPISLPGETRFEDTDPKAIAEAEAKKAKAEAAEAKAKADAAAAAKRQKSKGKKTSEADVTGPRHIYAGEDSILLGTKQRMAAHVQSPHTGGGRVAKGSDSVVVGKTQLAFARLGDPTTDKLNVKTGHEAILVG